MQLHIGTKQVTAQPMTRSDAEAHLGRNVGGDKHGDGYLVEYEGGYQAWSPKDVFDAAYRPTTGMTFGLAIEAMKAGKRVARAGWNGKGMWLGLVLGYDYNPDKGKATAHALGCEKLPWIGMKTADRCFVPWLASQSDMLATDWVVL